MTINMATTKTTAIVEPIPQFWVVKKCSSTAVPSVMTLFPPIKRVNMKSDKLGIKTACTPALTPFSERGQMTWVKVWKAEAPKSLLAFTKLSSKSFKALKIGKTIKGIEIYDATKIKLRSVNKICVRPIPKNCKKLLTEPYLPKIPIKA